MVLFQTDRPYITEKILYFVIQSTVHVFFYSIPKVVKTVLIALPQLLGSLFFKQDKRLRALRQRGKTIIVVGKYHHRHHDQNKKEEDGQQQKAEDEKGEEVDALKCFGFRRSTDPLLREFDFSNEEFTGPAYGGHIHTVLGSLNRPFLRPDVTEIHRDMTTSPYDGARLGIDWRYAIGRVPPRCSGKEEAAAGEEGAEKRERAEARQGRSSDGGEESGERESGREGGSGSIASASLPPPVGVLVIVPGLASHSGSNYIQRFMMHAARCGFHVAFATGRGMGTTPLDSNFLVFGKFLEDIRGLFSTYFSPNKMEKRFGLFPRWKRTASGSNSSHDEQLAPLPVVAIGFSLGGSLLSRYLSSTSASDTCLRAACIANAPLDFHTTCARLTQDILGNKAYQPSLIGGLNDAVRRHADKIGTHPSPQVREFVSHLVKRDRPDPDSLLAFDSLLTAPMHGFPHVEAYFTDVSPMPTFASLSIPTLIFVSADDPICGTPPSVAHMRAVAQANPNFLYVETPVGGHLGFLGTPYEEFGDQPNWMERRLVAAMAHACNMV